jgi:hypothetical protein
MPPDNGEPIGAPTGDPTPTPGLGRNCACAAAANNKAAASDATIRRMFIPLSVAELTHAEDRRMSQRLNRGLTQQRYSKHTFDRR